MRKLTEIWRAYTELDGHLDGRERRSASANARNRWRRRRNLNDQAYFVMLFACFEDRVTALCKGLVARKQSLRSWRQRRLWDTVELDRLDFVPFMRKVGLLLDRGRADYARVRGLYDTRCLIAHGLPQQVGPMSLPSLYQDIARLWRALRG